MTTQSRSSQSQDTHENDLLSSLLERPPSSNVRLPRVNLRSVEEQREHALRGFLRRTWVDGALKHSEWFLLLTALIVFGFWFYEYPWRDWQYERQAAAQEAAPAGAPTSAPTAPEQAASLPFVTEDMALAAPADDFITPRQITPPQPAVDPRPTRLMVPAINLDSPIKEVKVIDGVWEVADYAVGYMHGTALPEQNGNTALAGHAGIRGAVFRDIGALAPGDDIFLDAGGWRYHYRVRSSTAVWPTQVEILGPTTTPVLTMITCTNWDTQRLVVIADLVDSQQSPE
jgi:sortase A